MVIARKYTMRGGPVADVLFQTVDMYMSFAGRRGSLGRRLGRDHLKTLIANRGKISRDIIFNHILTNLQVTTHRAERSVIHIDM